MFKVDKNKEINDYVDWWGDGPEGYTANCTKRRGVPETMDHVNPQFFETFSEDEIFVGTSSEEEEEEEETEADRERELLEAPKRIRQFHRVTAVHNQHEKKKRRIMKIKEFVVKPSMRSGNGPPQILDLFATICDPTKKLPLQRFKNAMPGELRLLRLLRLLLLLWWWWLLLL